MTKYIITRASIINRCNSDGKEHLLITEYERPCEEAFLDYLEDNEGNQCSRFFVELDGSLEAVDKLADKYDVDVLVSRNGDFPEYIALVLYDEDIDKSLF